MMKKTQKALHKFFGFFIIKLHFVAIGSCGDMIKPSFIKRGILFVCTAILLWGGSAQFAYAGFGISPPYVKNDTLRPGSEYTQEIIIVRSDPVEDLNAELSMNLPGIEQWFSFDRGTQFVLPKGESQVKIHITVRVPDEAKLGGYTGNIRIRTASIQQPTTGVSLALGAQIDVRLKVVEEIIDFQVRRVELYEAEEGYKKWWLHFPGKIKFAMHIENTGNIPIAPPKITMAIYDVSGNQLLETTENTNKVDQVLPFATKKVYAYFPTWLPPGGYRVKYTIAKNEEEIAQQGELALAILPRGTIAGYEPYGFEGLSLPDKLTIVIPIGLVLLLILVIVLARRGRAPTPRVRRVVHDDDDDPPIETPRSRPRTPMSQRGGVVDLSRRR